MNETGDKNPKHTTSDNGMSHRTTYLYLRMAQCLLQQDFSVPGYSEFNINEVKEYGKANILVYIYRQIL